MMVIRPAHPDDLDGLSSLAEQTTFGLTTLPRDRDLLASRIDASVRAFQHLAKKPSGEAYLLVLEDLRTGQVIGTSGVVAKVGGFDPFYAYRIETSVHESQTLKVRKEIPTLHLMAEHNGPCEIGSLFLAPGHRGGGNGRLLSLARFLLIADHPDRFDPVVIAEMRGVIDEHGASPFWDAIGRVFFDIDFPTADYLSVVDKRFIADLMPRHPIYIPLLPPAAQAVIGQVHEKTRPARAILESEGFAFSGMVDIFEAGPILRCDRDAIRAVRESMISPVADIVEAPPNGEPSVVSNGRTDYRACLTPVEQLADGGVRLSAAAALALQVKVHDRIRHVTLKPAKE